MSSSAALQIIKEQGPISAKGLADQLRIGEKAARGLIDRLRAQGEPVWHDEGLGAFWWRDDETPGTIPHLKWKRTYS